MRLSKYLIPILIVATLAACSDLFSGNDNTPTLTFTTTAPDSSTVIFNGDTLVFRPIGDNIDFRNPPPFKSEVLSGRQIAVDGYFLVGCALSRLSWDISRSGDSIQIYIESEKRDQCPGIWRGVLYRAVISDLSVGTHTVQIEHNGDGFSPGFKRIEEEVFSEEFMIE